MQGSKYKMTYVCPYTHNHRLHLQFNAILCMWNMWPCLQHSDSFRDPASLYTSSTIYSTKKKFLSSRKRELSRIAHYSSIQSTPCLQWVLNIQLCTLAILRQFAVYPCSWILLSWQIVLVVVFFLRGILLALRCSLLILCTTS